MFHLFSLYTVIVNILANHNPTGSYIVNEILILTGVPRKLYDTFEQNFQIKPHAKEYILKSASNALQQSVSIY